MDETPSIARPSAPTPSDGAPSTIPQANLGIVTAPPLLDTARRCFICLADQDSDDPPDSWVDPCPCTLEAHQDCMLSWVTDCERSNKPLQCPICKSAIELDGPWDPIVAISDSIQRRFSRASPFVLFTSFSMGVQLSLQMYGAMALWTFSGKDVLLRFMLGPELVIDGRAPQGITFAKERIFNALVLMNVAPALLGARLLPSLSNKIFLPTASLYGIYHILHDDEFFTWPPSPQLAMAVFPYIRSVYHNIWRELVMPYEVKLNRQLLGLPDVEPTRQNAAGQGANNQRDGERNDQGNAEGGIVGFLQNLLDALDPPNEDQEDGDNLQQIQPNPGQANPAQPGNAGVVVEVVIEEVIEEQDAPVWEANEGQQGGLPEAIAPDWDWQAAEPEIFDEEDHQHQDHDAENGQGVMPEEERPQRQQHEAPPPPPARRLGLGAILSNVANAIVSSLILPGVSFIIGEALRLALPKTWTTSVVRNPWLRYGAITRPGFLQQQWGRSLVGGCLYVVLKDVVRVYAKSRKVAAMTNRKVKNVERSRRGK